MEKYISFKNQKRNQAVNDFEKDFYKILLNNAFYGKTMENVRNRLKYYFFEKDDEKIIKQQSNLTFKCIHKTYENCDSYTIKRNEILKDKPNYLGFATLDLSKLHMYETHYDKIQPYFGQEKLQLLYVDADAFIFSVNTKDKIRDLKSLGKI